MWFRLVLVVGGVVIGVGSLLAGNWWTASAMALLVLSQGLTERDVPDGAAAATSTCSRRDLRATDRLGRLPPPLNRSGARCVF
jgi:ABC-type Fe2+-enterobactin transport system substrate-binding protein